MTASKPRGRTMVAPRSGRRRKSTSVHGAAANDTASRTPYQRRASENQLKRNPHWRRSWRGRTNFIDGGPIRLKGDVELVADHSVERGETFLRGIRLAK